MGEGGGWRIREEKRRVMLEMDSSVMHTVTHSKHTDITTDATYRRYTHTHTHDTAGGSSAMHTQRILHTHTLHE